MLSVGLPLYRSGKIAWLALESLARQKPPDCPWELLIAEEREPGAFGEENIRSFEDRLHKVGCERVVYVPLEKWIPLGEKWKLLAKKAHPDSIAFLLQAADNYSGPRRLVTTAEYFRRGADWYETKAHVLFDCVTHRIVTYDSTTKGGTGADMAIRTEILRQITSPGPRKNVDGWLRSCAENLCRRQKRRFYRLLNRNNRIWRETINVSGPGINHLSNRRRIFDNPQPPYFRYWRVPIEEILPMDVAQRLLALR